MSIIETDLDGCSYEYFPSGDHAHCDDLGTDRGGASGGNLYFYGTSLIGPVERSYDGYLRWAVEQYTSVGRWQTHTGYIVY